MYMQAGELKRFHRESILNSMTWIVTIVAVVLIDVSIGLVAGILCSLIALYMKGWRATSYQLGSVPGTDLYANLATHPGCRTVPGICIFRYVGAVNFATAGGFKERLYSTTRVTQKTLRRASMLSTEVGGIITTTGGDENSKLLGQLHTIVIDLSSVTHMDVAGMKMCRAIERDMRLLDVRLVMAAPIERVLEVIQHAEWLEIGAFVVLPSVHDAVLHSIGSRVSQPAVETQPDDEMTTDVAAAKTSN